MKYTVIHKHSNQEDKSPASSAITWGELAINNNKNNPKIYVKVANNNNSDDIASFISEKAINEKIKPLNELFNFDTNTYFSNVSGLTLGKNVIWENDDQTKLSDVNDFIIDGVYNISGQRTRLNDNLPITNAGSGHTFKGILFVQNSSLTKIEPGNTKDNNVCVTQTLILSNRLGRDGNVYIRTGLASQPGEALTWGNWGKLQTNVEVGLVNDLNSYIDNGIYSGVYSGNDDNVETFIITTINNYAAAKENKSISQFKYSLNNYGVVTYKTRTKIKNEEWGDWEDIAVNNTPSYAPDNSFNEKFNELSGTTNSLSSSVNSLQTTVSELTGTTNYLQTKVSELSGTTDSLQNAVKGLDATTNSLSSSFNILENKVEGLTGLTSNVDNLQKKVNDNEQVTAIALYDLKSKIEKISGETTNNSNESDISSNEDFINLQTTVSELSETTDSLQTTVNGLSGTTNSLQTRVNGLDETTNSLKTMVNVLSGTTESLYGEMTNVIDKVNENERVTAIGINDIHFRLNNLLERITELENMILQ